MEWKGDRNERFLALNILPIHWEFGDRIIMVFPVENGIRFVTDNNWGNGLGAMRSKTE